MGKYKSKKIKTSSDIPVSDEEREREKENEMYEKYRINGSPKIVKIMKKRTAFPNMFTPNDIYENNNLNTEQNVDNIKQNVAKSLNFKSL